MEEGTEFGPLIEELSAVGQEFTYGTLRSFLPPSPHAVGSFVKLIIAIIQPGKLEAVKEALTEVEVFRLTVVDCQGFGRQKGHPGLYRGLEIGVNLLRKVQLQIAVNEEFVQPQLHRSNVQSQILRTSVLQVPDLKLNRVYFHQISAEGKNPVYHHLNQRLSPHLIFEKDHLSALG